MNIRDLEKGAGFGDLTISFQSKQPYRTWFLVVAHPVGKFPSQLAKDLEGVGWKKEDVRGVAFEGREETVYSKMGTAIFGCWTAEEGRNAMKDAKAVLKKNGIVGVPKVKLTLQDML